MLQPNTCQIKGNCLITYLGIMAVILFLIISPFSDRHQWMLLPGGDFLRYLGVILFILGNILIFWKSINIGLIMICISIPLVFLSSLGLLLALFASIALFEQIARKELYENNYS